jgi:hypothetical protein
MRSLLIALAVLLAAALSLSACARESGDSAGDPAPAPVVATEPAPEPTPAPAPPPAGVPAPEPGTVSITCIDLVNEGQASACAAADATASEPRVLETIGGPVSRSATSAVNYSHKNTTAAPFPFVTVSAMDLICPDSVFAAEGRTYAVFARSVGTLKAGTAMLFGAGIGTCHGGAPGEYRLYTTLYSGDAVWDQGDLFSWVPGTDPMHIVSEAILVFTLTE